jgi:transposase
MTKRTYRKFSPEFKREAVRLAEQTDGPITQVARELGIRVNQIYKWRRQIKEKQDAAFPGSGRRAAKEDELMKLGNPATDCFQLMPLAYSDEQVSS